MTFVRRGSASPTGGLGPAAPRGLIRCVNGYLNSNLAHCLGPERGPIAPS